MAGREIAFDPRQRRLQERKESLLIDSTVVDFVIQPTLAVTLVDSDNGSPRPDIDFSWKLLDFTAESMELALDFKDLEQVSENREPVNLVVTFWHGEPFIVEESGLPIPNGYSIFAELVPQEAMLE